MVERRSLSIRVRSDAASDGSVGTRRGEHIVNRDGFTRFWADYPRKVGRLAAIKEWNKLNPDETFVIELLAGVELYKRTKPEYADWCHPRTFLAQGRWMDEADAPAVTGNYEWVCLHQPHCRHRAECLVIAMRKEHAS